MNRTLIAAKGTVTRGSVYRLVDRSAKPGVRYTYRLQVVGRDGKRTWRASAKVRVRR